MCKDHTKWIDDFILCKEILIVRHCMCMWCNVIFEDAVMLSDCTFKMYAHVMLLHYFFEFDIA